jgi:hypothetical protein
MIILCLAVIAYDIIVLIDPTRCFFLNCDDATVDISNSTTYITTSGWPLNITWPDYFQTNMNAKRIFQSIQILCASLFILFASLYLLTYYIYRHMRLDQQTIYDVDRRTFTKYETNRATPIRRSNNVSPIYPSFNPHHKITTYTIEGRPYSSTETNYSPQPVTKALIPRKTKSNTFIRPRANSVNYDQLCTRCNREPRMILVSNYERQNFFPHLCINCNNDLVNDRQKPSLNQSSMNRVWRP